MANQMKKLPSFTSERRRQLLAIMMEGGVSSKEAFNQNKDELVGYGVEDHKALHKILYPLSRQFEADLNKIVSNSSVVKRVLEEDVESLPAKNKAVIMSRRKALNTLLESYKSIGFSPLERSEPYQTISTSGETISEDVLGDIDTLESLLS